jgi:hypothetical protein
MAPQPFIGLWRLFHFHDPICNQWISPLTRPLPTDIHVLSAIRTHNPSVQASEGSSCLRPRNHCGRQLLSFTGNFNAVYTWL